MISASRLVMLYISSKFSADRPRWWTTEDFACAMTLHNKSSSSQQACDVKMTSHRCWCGVITPHRRRHDTNTAHTIKNSYYLGRLKNYKYSQTCLKGSPKRRTKSGCLRHVTGSFALIFGSRDPEKVAA